MFLPSVWAQGQTLWLAYRYRDRNFTDRSTGSGSRGANRGVTGNGIEDSVLRVPGI